MDAQFTPDGNSIVSGGQEAVLVHSLWKTDEDQKYNFIPRLDGPIIWVLSEGIFTVKLTLYVNIVS